MPINKTEPILIQSLPKNETVLHRLTLMESIDLSKKKTSYFGYLKDVVLAISNIDEMQMKFLSIQDAIALTVYYRMYFWDDMPVTEEPELKPSDFIGGCDMKFDKDASIVKIGDFRFSPMITMDKAIEAERFCASMNDIPNLRFYIIGAGCTKSVKDGIDAIKSIMDGSKEVGTLIKLDSMMGTLSNISLTMLSEDGKIAILSNGQGGEERYALPFRGSRFLAFGI